MKERLMEFCSKVPFLRLIKFPNSWILDTMTKVVIPKGTLTKEDIEDWNNPAKIKEYEPGSEGIGYSASCATTFPKTCKWCGNKMTMENVFESIGSNFCGLRCETEYRKSLEKEKEDDS